MTKIYLALSAQDDSDNHRHASPVANWRLRTNRQVTVVLADGKALKGELTGVDTYKLFVKQSDGLEVMINKGAIKYLHPAATD